MKRAGTSHPTWERSPAKRRLPVTDPYLTSRSGPRAVCPDCGLTYRDKRWAFERRVTARKTAAVPLLLCPACRKIRAGDYQGEVVLTGPWMKIHRREVEAVLRHEQERAMDKNPLERIMESRWEGGRLVVRTTVKKLAQRLGRAVHNAFKGELSLGLGKADAPARVRWEK
jgi:hypothetical protein